MRKLICITLLGMAVLCPPLQAQEVQGDTLTVSGRQLIYLWGTHSERGFALGYLMGEPIREIFEQYFLGYYLNGSLPGYNYLHGYFSDHFQLEQKYQLEAEGIVEGMLAAGNDPYCELLEREVDATDILVVNAIVDYAALSREPEVGPLPHLGCSSLSSWGAATMLDPWLQGELVFTRLMDWSPHSVLHANHLLVIQLPSELDEQPWISFTFPGLIGALSAVNASGVGAFLNMGNYHTGSAAELLHPALLSVRNGIEAADYDQSGQCDPGDPAAALMDQHQRSGVLVHLLDALPGDARIIECNNALGQVLRDQADNTVIPGDNLVATNHFRLLYTPSWCYRYENILDSLLSDPDISATRQWDLLGGAAGTWSNLHAIQYTPATGRLLWGISSNEQAGYQEVPVEFFLDELLSYEAVLQRPVPLPAGIRFELYPNPANGEFRLQFALPEPATVSVAIYNLLGQEVERLLDERCDAGVRSVDWKATDQPSGLYIASLTAGGDRLTLKMLLLK